MTDEQIKQWARAAGLANQFVTAEMLAMFRRMCESAAAAEREACAEIAEDEDHRVEGRGYYDQLGDARLTAANIAQAIRARGAP